MQTRQYTRHRHATKIMTRTLQRDAQLESRVFSGHLDDTLLPWYQGATVSLLGNLKSNTERYLARARGLHVTGAPAGKNGGVGCGWIADLRKTCRRLPHAAEVEDTRCCGISDLGRIFLRFQGRHVRPSVTPPNQARSTRRQLYGCCRREIHGYEFSFVIRSSPPIYCRSGGGITTEPSGC